jgi:hypothetical protein
MFADNFVPGGCQRIKASHSTFLQIHKPAHIGPWQDWPFAIPNLGRNVFWGANDHIGFGLERNVKPGFHQAKVGKNGAFWLRR